MDAWITRIIPITESQHDVFSRAQALRAGLSGDDINRLVRGRRLSAVYRNVYRLARVPAGPRPDAIAAVLAAEPVAGDGWCAAASTVVASHWTVAALWPCALDAAPVPAHVIGQRQCRVRGIVAHRVTLAADERTVLHGIPVTTPTRTLLDLAAIASTRQLEQAHAVAERMGLVDRRQLRLLLGRHLAARGSALLRRMVDELDATGTAPLFLRSLAEAEGLAMVRSGGLPRPAANTHVLGLEVDFLWEALRLIMEVDGLEFHASPEAVQRDRHRDRTLVGAGYMVLRFTWRQLTRERDQSLATLAAAIGARQQLLAMGAMGRSET